MGASREGGILPDGYTQLEYIENINNSYIDTGYQLDFSETIECEVAIMQYTQYGFLFGNYNSDSHNCTRVILGSANSSSLVACYNTSAGSGNNGIGYPNYLKKTKIVLTPTRGSVDDEYYDLTNTTQDSAYNGNILIGRSQTQAKARYYSFSISGKRNMIPCISPSNVVGMYDTIGNQFYSSLSNTAFVAGPIVRDIPYQEIEYLQSDGYSYIDTNIGGGNDNLAIDGTFLYSGFYNYASVFSNYVGENINMTRLILQQTDNGQAYASVNRTSNGVNGTPKNKLVNFRLWLGNFWSFYDNQYTATTISSNNRTANNANILLYRSPSWGDSSCIDIGLKIYRFTIRDNVSVLRDFVPVRVGQVGYLYDKVSGQLFGNVGQGDFILGADVAPIPYQQVEYLESTGTQYLLTGVPSSGSNYIKIKLIDYFTDQHLGSWPFGGRNSFLSNEFGLFISADDSTVLARNGSTAITCETFSTYPSSSIVRLGHSVVAIKTYRYTYTQQNFSGSYSVILFGLNNGGTAINGKFKIGATYISGASVTRDFVPVRVGNVGYMYDKISKQLFGSYTTDDFLPGPDVVDIPYQRIEYLGNGQNNHYCKIVPNVTGEMRIVGRAVALSNRASSILACTRSDFEVGSWFGVNGSGYWGLGAAQGAYANISATTPVDFDISFGNTVTSGTVDTQNVSRNALYAQTDLFLFSASTASSYYFEGYLYFLKIYKSGQLVRDLVPVRIGTTGYMYDTVSGELFGNSGTGSFVLGADLI